MAGRPSSRIEQLAVQIVSDVPPEVAARLSKRDVQSRLGIEDGTAESVRRLVAGYALAGGHYHHLSASTIDRCRASFAALGAAAAFCSAGDVKRTAPGTSDAVAILTAAMVRGMALCGTRQEAPAKPAATQPPVPTANDVLLVVGDAHAAPGANLARFCALGRMTAEIAPTHVVQVGDFFDLPSLSTWDRGKATGEGRRFTDDMDAGNRALDLWHQFGGDALERADRLFTEGNHEERGGRYINEHPELVGVLSDPCATFSDMGWRVARFLDVGEIAGFHVSHYWHPKGNTRTAIGGTVYPARALRMALLNDSISGHTHAESWERFVPPIGKPIHSLVAGCYDDASHGWAKRDNVRYAVGVSVLRRYDDGWTREWIPMPVVMQRWGSPDDYRHTT